MSIGDFDSTLISLLVRWMTMPRPQNWFKDTLFCFPIPMLLALLFFPVCKFLDAFDELLEFWWSDAADLSLQFRNQHWLSMAQWGTKCHVPAQLVVHAWRHAARYATYKLCGSLALRLWGVMHYTHKVFAQWINVWVCSLKNWINNSIDTCFSFLRNVECCSPNPGALLKSLKDEQVLQELGNDSVRCRTTPALPGTQIRRCKLSDRKNPQWAQQQGSSQHTGQWEFAEQWESNNHVQPDWPLNSPFSANCIYQKARNHLNSRSQYDSSGPRQAARKHGSLGTSLYMPRRSPTLSGLQRGLQ